MESIADRRQNWLKKLRSPSEKDGVIAHLKSLLSIPPNEPLPNGTPIISEIIRQEDARSEPTAAGR